MPKHGPIEICGELPRRRYKVAVFDFDGTVSWLRHGWPGIMCRLFRAHYEPPGGTGTLMDEILSLNGKPTIHQMRTFHERAKSAGVSVPSPEDLLAEYHRQLYATIAGRRESIERQTSSPDDFLVAGARNFIEALVESKVKLYVLSGTVQPQVRAEAQLLDVSQYFNGNIFGSPENPAGFTKMAMFKQFLAQEKIEPEELLAFGDGPIEIENVKSLGGMAIGVASNEELNGGAERDQRKAGQLAEAGANAIIADYDCGNELLKELFS